MTGPLADSAKDFSSISRVYIQGTGNHCQINNSEKRNTGGMDFFGSDRPLGDSPFSEFISCPDMENDNSVSLKIVALKKSRTFLFSDSRGSGSDRGGKAATSIPRAFTKLMWFSTLCRCPVLLPRGSQVLLITLLYLIL